MDPLYLKCPHCDGEIIVFQEDINCAIFRHAIYKDGSQINPHASKEECDKLAADGVVFGCVKPFKLEKNEQGIYEIFKCDYI